MPHQCVRCGTIYSDGSRELLEGCSKCNGKFFFYIRKEKMMGRAEELRKTLSKKQLTSMEHDVRGLLSKDNKKEKPVILDIETIKVKGPGKYEIDVVSLMSGKPIIIKVGDGKYFIDLITAFEKK